MYHRTRKPALIFPHLGNKIELSIHRLYLLCCQCMQLQMYF